jgi:cell division protein FtsI (penicillin-binding protein 3)
VDSARSRFAYMTGMLLLAFVAVEARFFFLQIRKHKDYAEGAVDAYVTQEKILAARGSILMRNDYPLAESVPALRIWADSNWTGYEPGKDKPVPAIRDRTAARIEEALGHPIENLRAALDKPGYQPIATEAVRTGKGKSVQPLRDGDGISRLLEARRRGELPGITLESTWIRSYPETDLAANVVGYVDTVGDGRAGIEMSFDSDLRGIDGRRDMMRDVRRRAIFDVGCEAVAPTAGHDVHLTIDAVLQFYLEEALAKVVTTHKPKWVAGIVLDPSNGEVLAMATLPSFDPNQYSNYDIETHQNRCVTYGYTPGSTFKPFIMAAAVEWTNLSPNALYDCSKFKVDGRSIEDAHPHKRLSVSEIMAESSNIGMCKIMMRLCPDPPSAKEKQFAAFTKIRGLLTDLGFGRKTEIGFAQESSGKLSAASQWTRKYTLASLSFGHEIMVTPVQLAAAFATFANDGVYNKPNLVEKVVAADGTIVRKHVPEQRRIFSRATSDKVRAMLVSVVDEGTGMKAALTGYTAAGKTSTAQDERDPRKYTSSFAGFAPANKPRLVVSIVVDQPTRGGHYGGTVAAPAAADVLQRGLLYLRVPQDRRD